MRGHRCERSRSETDTETDSETETMRCISCKEEYGTIDAGTCKECYEEASETEEELKREIEDLKAKVAFLRFWSPLDHHHSNRSTGPCFTDVVLIASSDDGPTGSPVPVPAHKAVLVSRSPVFKAMLENEMEESHSGTIKISDVSYDALRMFINYLYTAEACLDEQMACDLLVLAEKYQVKHLKAYCEKFLVSKLNWNNSVPSYAFAHLHNAKHMTEAALSLITDNMDKLTKREEYKELVEKDPRLVVEIYEAYLSKQVNTAAPRILP
ncbi:BTB/POZ domain-containing protein At4g08455 [Ricinus communis]|uniref:Protein binding protein, putative n=1 Tax=Ricinus communis TaxID=3988 RepID=B9S2S7_RICCO|nr:BTB/POZ domain-containing protein At4g08455 [Ricinus communis]XP_015575362.1 BTB/POZ domain-containing protein At4g08455 [Ricinus communis]EEF42082.1 protein binding protein, putative [Ricinus communis]|eukprot:XP_002520296.1 BTB/POZ domain-containing protein At4g08455 [Ricinus communis]